MENSKLRATPAARDLAKMMGIDLLNVRGSGAKGRIHKEDVEEFNFEKKVRITPLASKIAQEYNIEVIPMSPMRKVIAKRMSDSYFTAPTFTLNYEVDMTELISLRKKVMDTIMENTGKKITVTDLISFAVVKTLMKHKYVNSELSADGTQITLHNYVNLSIAVGMDDGLLVPVIKGADKMSLSELVVASKDIIKKALAMKLSPSEQSGSTFTISNLGMFGTQSFNPIINQPNSAILGVAATVEKPVVVDGEIVIRPIMTMCLTIDHRVVDGLAGAKFMQDLKKLLENPLAMLI